MPNTITHKKSTTASAVPSGASLSAGEIAINTADGRLFIKKSDGTVVAIGRDASELNTGTVAAARLPAATGSTLGAIIVGTGLGVASGTVSVSYGSTSSTACVGNDSRLSDTRTPTDGSVTTAKIADGAVTAAKIAASQALSVASVSATGNISSNATVSGASVSASTGGVTVSAGAIVIETLGAVTTFRVSSGGIVTSGTWQGATIAVANGGTGATTAADARTNLGAAASSHTHGNITNAGSIGSTANLPVITTTSGVLTTGTFGTAANSFCQGNDSRLSDARTPTAHKSTHATGGTDALTASDIGAAAAASPTITGTLTLSGGQIAFPASASISSSANTLDDYEEGTFTPSYTGSTGNPTCTYAARSGCYTKVGRVVTFTIRLALSAKSGGTGNLYVSGLPFTSANTTNVASPCIGTKSGFSTNGPSMAYIQPNDTYIVLLLDSNTVNTAITTANLGTGSSDLMLTGVYETDS